MDGAAGALGKTIKRDKAKYYILIDLIVASQWTPQRYLTRITPFYQEMTILGKCILDGKLPQISKFISMLVQLVK